MNPVLIKPEGDRKAQLVVRGEAQGTLWASRFKEDRPPLLPLVVESFERLRDAYDVVLVEGAGSPAEPNLREGDIANLGFAQAVGVDAWLVGDIDRGGVIDIGPEHSATYAIHHAFLRDPDGNVLEIQRFDDPDWAAGP